MKKNYENVVGGALRLKRNKGIAATLTHPLLKKHKKKKKSPLFEKDNPPLVVDAETPNQGSFESVHNHGIVSDISLNSQNDKESAVDESSKTFSEAHSLEMEFCFAIIVNSEVYDILMLISFFAEADIEEKLFLTPSQRVFRAAQRQREDTRVDERLRLTHRQRVEKLNQHLSTLSEHFDIPKVGPG
ncbi:hypothetical protein IE077_003165 [Cardiosporidium cionae]|uniref:Uncharacterized protein n=1 Tax=Cardiosporidium cionae TaxID=476202 RepID=A0ABQ7J8Y1_9APIC|nr:hypothetical protein IE077_003165 [Cardiosporidium cionae]|eukprot:KAF8820453.1 hypothetical protein IE077_003165 [Cardiosporidium cionae]